MLDDYNIYLISQSPDDKVVIIAKTEEEAFLFFMNSEQQFDNKYGDGYKFWNKFKYIPKGTFKNIKHKDMKWAYDNYGHIINMRCAIDDKHTFDKDNKMITTPNTLTYYFVEYSICEYPLEIGKLY